MNRQEIISKYFTNIKLDASYLDIYYARKSILRAIEVNLPEFKGTLLDVGCGIMPYRELILTRNKNVTSHIGLDFENSINPEYALGKPDLFWKGDVIPVGDHSIDTVIATEFFEHCPEPEKAMQEMIRVLKPGGILFFTVPFIWNLHIAPYDEYRYTPFALQRHLQNAGFRAVYLEALGRWDASLAQMIALWYQNRGMRPVYKKFLKYLLLPVITRLIKADSNLKETGTFRDGDMMTGLCGTAYK